MQNKETFEARLTAVLAEIKETDIEEVANWRLTFIMSSVCVIACIVGLAAVAMAHEVPTWVAPAAIILEAASGLSAMVIHQFRLFGRRRA